MRLCGRSVPVHPSQPLYLSDGTQVLAGALLPSFEIMTADGQHYTVSKVSRVKNDADVYTLPTDHPTHNFLVAGLICGNNPPPPHDDDRRRKGKTRGRK